MNRVNCAWRLEYYV